MVRVMRDWQAAIVYVQACNHVAYVLRIHALMYPICHHQGTFYISIYAQGACEAEPLHRVHMFGAASCTRMIQILSFLHVYKL